MEGLEISSDVSNFNTINGEGVEATVAGQKVQVGNRRMALRLGLIQPPQARGTEMVDMAGAADEWESKANTVCWVAIDGQLAGLIGVADTIRSDAKDAIAILKARDVRVVMLTGDNEGTARAVQKQLGLDEIQNPCKFCSLKEVLSIVLDCIL